MGLQAVKPTNLILHVARNETLLGFIEFGMEATCGLQYLTFLNGYPF